MPDYQAGELDQRIGLQSSTKARDAGGGAATSWSDYDEVWAKVRPMAGRERQNAERQEAHSDYLVVIRYRDDVLEKHRIRWRGRYLNVRFIRNAGPREPWLELECEMGADS